MADKVTVMILKVDLQCCSCYKKVKKILCKFPQIRDQIYDEKENKVIIKVVCCSPEKLRDKLCCKGAKVIKSIEIVEPPKPKPAEKPKDLEKPKPAEKPKDPEKPKPAEKPKDPEKPKPAEKPKDPEKPKPAENPKPPTEKPKEDEKPKPAAKPPNPDKPKDPAPAPAPAPVAPEPVQVTCFEPVCGYPPMPIYPGGSCCEQCYHGYGGGPCFRGYGRPVPPPPGPCYDGYWYTYGYGYRGNRSSCCEYFSEENPQGCTIM